jgi:hypothetical protein
LPDPTHPETCANMLLKKQKHEHTCPGSHASRSSYWDTYYTLFEAACVDIARKSFHIPLSTVCASNYFQSVLFKGGNIRYRIMTLDKIMHDSLSQTASSFNYSRVFALLWWSQRCVKAFSQQNTSTQTLCSRNYSVRRVPWQESDIVGLLVPALKHELSMHLNNNSTWCLFVQIGVARFVVCDLIVCEPVPVRVRNWAREDMEDGPEHRTDRKTPIFTHTHRHTQTHTDTHRHTQTHTPWPISCCISCMQPGGRVPLGLLIAARGGREAPTKATWWVIIKTHKWYLHYTTRQKTRTHTNCNVIDWLHMDTFSREIASFLAHQEGECASRWMMISPGASPQKSTSTRKESCTFYSIIRANS